MKIRFFYWLLFFVCILPTQSVSRNNSVLNFLKPSASLQEFEVELAHEDDDALRFNPCIRTINSKLCVIDSKMDTTDCGCERIPIRQEDLTDPTKSTPATGYIIDTPGHYCCATNLDGNAAGVSTLITISSSDVLLDLNGHQLLASSGGNGIASGFHTNIVVKNGFIVGNEDGTSNFGLYTILVDNSVLDRLSIREFSAGCFILECNTAFIGECMLLSNSINLFLGGSANISIDHVQSSSTHAPFSNVIGTCNNIVIRHSLFSANSRSGLFLSLCNNCSIESCQFNDNNTLFINNLPTAGLHIDDSSDITVTDSEFSISSSTISAQRFGVLCEIDEALTKNITIERCVANNNIVGGFFWNETACFKVLNCTAMNNGPVGFVATFCNDSVIENCFASNNEVGFIVDACENVCFIKSTAKDNIIGFSLNTPGSGLLKECVAVGNGICGFEDSSGSPSRYKFVANLGQGNGITPAPLSSSMIEMFDTNYCTSYVDPGPAGLPYKQANPLSPNTPAPFLGYWNNITLP